ncbi:MAG: zinc-ribbon domain-containing protein [Gemmatimonadales bacterium]
MNVTCPGCSTVFRVDPAKVPAGGVRARCSVCRAVFRVESAGAAPVGLPAAASPPAHTPAPMPATPPVQDSPAASPPPPPPPRASAPAPTPTPAYPTDHGIGAPPFVVPPPRSTPARPAAPTYPSAPSPGPRTCGRRSHRDPSIATPSAPRTSSPRPSINPFLSKDPGQKARRLARALVSDIVVYHPEKRLEGLQHGTLKQIFDEEIKKSWEEYTGQVGRELAESTTHFNDALNEILGDGSKIF